MSRQARLEVCADFQLHLSSLPGTFGALYPGLFRRGPVVRTLVVVSPWRTVGECVLPTDTVEKVVVRRPSITSEKIDLSDRLRNRSQPSTKGKTTHENRVRTTSH